MIRFAYLAVLGGLLIAPPVRSQAESNDAGPFGPLRLQVPTITLKPAAASAFMKQLLPFQLQSNTLDSPDIDITIVDAAYCGAVANGRDRARILMVAVISPKESDESEDDESDSETPQSQAVVHDAGAGGTDIPTQNDRGGSAASQSSTSGAGIPGLDCSQPIDALATAQLNRLTDLGWIAVLDANAVVSGEKRNVVSFEPTKVATRGVPEVDRIVRTLGYDPSKNLATAIATNKKVFRPVSLNAIPVTTDVGDHVFVFNFEQSIVFVGSQIVLVLRAREIEGPAPGASVTTLQELPSSFFGSGATFVIGIPLKALNALLDHIFAALPEGHKALVLAEFGQAPDKKKLIGTSLRVRTSTVPGGAGGRQVPVLVTESDGIDVEPGGVGLASRLKTVWDQRNFDLALYRVTVTPTSFGKRPDCNGVLNQYPCAGYDLSVRTTKKVFRTLSSFFTNRGRELKTSLLTFIRQDFDFAAWPNNVQRILRFRVQGYSVGDPSESIVWVFARPQ